MLKRLFSKNEPSKSVSLPTHPPLHKAVSEYLYLTFGFGVHWMKEVDSDEQFRQISFERIPLCFAYGTGELTDAGSLNYRMGVNHNLIECVAELIANERAGVGDITYEAELVAKALFDCVTNDLYDLQQKSGLSVEECCLATVAADMRNRGKLPNASETS